MSNDYVKRDFTPTEEAIGRDAEMKRAFLEEAGLEGASVEYLRKQMLSGEEAIAAKKEQLDDIRVRKSRKPDWDEYVDAKRRWGRALHHSDLIRSFRKLIPNLCVIDGVMRHKDGSIDLGIYVWDRTAPFESKTGGTVYLGYMHSGWNPEYEIDLVNEVGIATRKLRGWRTTLLNMICRRDPQTFYPKSVLTEEQAQEEFGFPTNGNTASNYRERLYRFRNQTPEAARQQWLTAQAMQKYRYA
jgi:hypothetical protein